MGRKHRVKRGECIEGIAARYGWRPDMLWEHPENEALRERRKNPNVLYAGGDGQAPDVVSIPELRRREEEVASGQRHRFRRIGVPSRLRLKLGVEGEPRAIQRYRLWVDSGGADREGTTTDSGEIDEWVPPGAKKAFVQLEDLSLEVMLAHLDPIDTRSGLIQRLANMEYLNSIAEGEDEDLLQDGVADFQQDQGMEPTGEADAATIDALQRVYGL
jgi:hypothetical protein